MICNWVQSWNCWLNKRYMLLIINFIVVKIIITCLLSIRIESVALCLPSQVSCKAECSTYYPWLFMYKCLFIVSHPLHTRAVYSSSTLQGLGLVPVPPSKISNNSLAIFFWICLQISYLSVCNSRSFLVSLYTKNVLSISLNKRTFALNVPSISVYNHLSCHIYYRCSVQFLYLYF